MHESQHHDRSLTAALRTLAEHDAGRGVSPDVEARLLAEVRSIARARRQAYAKTFAIAAGLLVAVAVPIWHLVERPAIVATDTESPADLTGELATEFLPLTYSNVPVTGGQIVRLEVPEMALATFGLAPVDFLDASPTVLAEVLVGEDGLARAVRFVRPANVAQEEQPQ